MDPSCGHPRPQIADVVPFPLPTDDRHPEVDPNPLTPKTGFRGGKGLRSRNGGGQVSILRRWWIPVLRRRRRRRVTRRGWGRETRRRGYRCCRRRRRRWGRRVVVIPKVMGERYRRFTHLIKPEHPHPPYPHPDCPWYLGVCSSVHRTLLGDPRRPQHLSFPEDQVPHLPVELLLSTTNHTNTDPSPSTPGPPLGR